MRILSKNFILEFFLLKYGFIENHYLKSGHNRNLEKKNFKYNKI